MNAMSNSSSFDYMRSTHVQWGYPPGSKLVDLVPDDMKSMIHPHWQSFPPVNPMVHYILGSLYIVIGITSFFGKSTNNKSTLTAKKTEAVTMFDRQLLGHVPVFQDQGLEDASQQLRGEFGLLRHVHDAVPVPDLRLQLIRRRCLVFRTVHVRIVRRAGRRLRHVQHQYHGRHLLRSLQCHRSRHEWHSYDQR